MVIAAAGSHLNIALGASDVSCRQRRIWAGSEDAKLGVVAKIAVGGVAVYVLFCLGMFLAQTAFLFHPSPERGSPAQFGLDDFQRVALRTDDGVGLVGWFHDDPNHDKAVIFFYGNADSLPPYAAFFRSFAAAGYSVLGVNYRGYGGSAGDPSETGFYSDADAALKFMNRHVPTEKITVIGRSIGTGVAVDLGAKHKLASLVLISPYTSVVNLASEAFWYLPVGYLLKHRFSSIDSIGDVNSPLLIVHGDADRVIPVLHAKLLHEAANDPKQIEIFEGSNHIFMDLERIFDLVIAFNERRQAR